MQKPLENILSYTRITTQRLIIGKSKCQKHETHNTDANTLIVTLMKQNVTHKRTFITQSGKSKGKERKYKIYNNNNNNNKT